MDLYKTIKVWVGSGAYIKDIREMKKIVNRANDLVGKAKMCGIFSETVQQAFQKMKTAEEALGKISKTLDKVDSLYQDVETIKKIRVAMAILNDEHIIRYNPQKAAWAFGVLFEGFGHFAEYLPQPAKAYAGPLKVLGGSFTKIVSELHPRTRKAWGGQYDQIGIDMGY
ncbi:MAG: hypothetical protein R2747_24315 [Pyrinomonadaceae bacterium]